MSFYSVPISFSGPGDHTIVVASGAPIEIKRIDFRVDDNTNVTIKDGASSLSGSCPMQSYAEFTWGYDGTTKSPSMTVKNRRILSGYVK